jgi:glycosyltransferase involved in cell wall biosynthesis
VAREQPDVTFAFVGPGPRLAATGTHPRILDIGSASARERAAWLDAADLLCLPSAGEIFPVSVLEAWSVGTPVLTSDLPTLTELVGGTGGGDTVRRDPQALAGAIVRLLGDTQRRHAMGEAGRRRWAERYTPRAVAVAHEQLYGQMIEGRVAECAR